VEGGGGSNEQVENDLETTVGREGSKEHLKPSEEELIAGPLCFAVGYVKGKKEKGGGAL
jgi:hypothetical protein